MKEGATYSERRAEAGVRLLQQRHRALQLGERPERYHRVRVLRAQRAPPALQRLPHQRLRAGLVAAGVPQRREAADRR